MALRSRDPTRRSAVAAGWVPRRCHSPCQALIDVRASPTSDVINTGWRPVASGRTYVCKWDGRAQPRANVRTSGTLQAEPCGERRPDRSARRSAAPRSWSRRLRTERSRSRHRRPVCLVRCCGSGGQRRDRVSTVDAKRRRPGMDLRACHCQCPNSALSPAARMQMPRTGDLPL